MTYTFENRYRTKDKENENNSKYRKLKIIVHLRNIMILLYYIVQTIKLCDVYYNYVTIENADSNSEPPDSQLTALSRETTEPV